MKKDLTELVFIIDMSGSMRKQTASTIDGFNRLIAEQKKTPGEKLVTLTLFNTRAKDLYLRIPIEEVGPLTEEEYQARGSTALLDALQTTMNNIGNIHMAADEKDLPENTIFFITTDGLENASRWYTAENVKGSIEYHRENDGWEFVFLAANLDAVSTAAEYGIRGDRTVRYYDDDRGNDLKFRAMNRFIDHVVYKADDADWSEDVRADYRARSKEPPSGTK